MLLRQQERSGGTRLLIARSEIIGKRWATGGSEAKETVAVALARERAVGVERPVSSDDKNIAARVRRRAPSALPDSALDGGRGGHLKGSRLLQRTRVIGKEPAVV